jgi:hypothetical protein
MWGELRTLQRENALVQAIMPFSHEVERTWSEQSGRDHCGFELAPGASSTIEGVIKDLGEGHDALPSRRWSSGKQDTDTLVGVNCGCAYCLDACQHGPRTWVHPARASDMRSARGQTPTRTTATQSGPTTRSRPLACRAKWEGRLACDAPAARMMASIGRRPAPLPSPQWRVSLEAVRRLGRPTCRDLCLPSRLMAESTRHSFLGGCHGQAHLLSPRVTRWLGGG